MLASNELMKLLGRKSLTELGVVQAVALGVTEPQNAEEAFNFTKAAVPKVLPKGAVGQLLLYVAN